MIKLLCIDIKKYFNWHFLYNDMSKYTSVYCLCCWAHYRYT